MGLAGHKNEVLLVSNYKASDDSQEAFYRIQVLVDGEVSGTTGKVDDKELCELIEKIFALAKAKGGVGVFTHTPSYVHITKEEFLYPSSSLEEAKSDDSPTIH